MAAAMVATPTGASMHHLDFLDRLAIAEQRDSHRAVAHQMTTPSQQGGLHPHASVVTAKPSRTQDPKPKKRRALSFHPQVVTQIETTHGFSDSRLRETNITEYTPEEEKVAIAARLRGVSAAEGSPLSKGASLELPTVPLPPARTTIDAALSICSGGGAGGATDEATSCGER